MISNKTLDSKKNIIQKTMNSEVIVSNDSKILVINNAEYRQETNLSINYWLEIKIIRNAKEDKNNVFLPTKRY